MLETTRQNYKVIATIVATIASGLPLWTNGTSRVDFTDPYFVLLWLGVGVLFSFLSQIVISLKLKDMISSFASGYTLAVIIYFIGSILITNIVHSQFIISLVVSIVCGVVSGWAGSLLWTGIRLKKKK